MSDRKVTGGRARWDGRRGSLAVFTVDGSSPEGGTSPRQARTLQFPETRPFGREI